MSLRLRQILTVLVGILVAVGMLLLGLWQLARFQESMADVAQERAAQAAVSLDSVLAAGELAPEGYGRRVEVTGTVEPGSVLVGSSWPLRAVIPIRLSSGEVLPVVLGTVSPKTEIPVSAGSKLTLTGVLTASDLAADEEVAPADAPEGSLATLRLQALAQEWPTPLLAGYVTAPQDFSESLGLGTASVVLPEGGGTAMHQGYALQWWVFAAAAVAFSVVVARGLGRKKS